MKFFFCPKTLTFHIENVPEGSLPITREKHSEILQGMSAGLTIRSGPDGQPVLIDIPKKPEMEERAWRDARISSIEWLANRHRDELDMQLATTLTAEQFAELLTYRQALRDWPQLELFPDSNHRPVAPLWIAEHAQ